jgi:DNA polymerase III epsilon subunit-like protein
MKTDIMIDLETLATSPNAAVLTIGAVKFDPFGDEVNEPNCEKFYVRVDLDSCDRIGLVTNDDTIAKHSIPTIELTLLMPCISCINSVGGPSGCGVTGHPLMW